MKTFAVLAGALLLAAGASADAPNCAAVALSAIPQCAQSCFLKGAPEVGCGGTDFACQCEQEARLYAAIEGCVASGCPAQSYQAVIDGASSVCNCAVGGNTAGGSMTVGSMVNTVSNLPATASSKPTGSVSGGGGKTTPPATVPAVSTATGATSAAARSFGLDVAVVAAALFGFTGFML